MKSYRLNLVSVIVVLASAFAPHSASAADYTVERIILPPNPFAGDNFGQSIADVGGNVAVGVPNEQAGGPGDQAFDDGGIVYLFEASSGEFLRNFVSPEPVEGGNFGETVTTLGNDILVGAPGESDGGVVYLIDGNTGGLLQTFQPAGLSQSARFGASIATDGALVAVGAPGDDGGGADIGSAYLCNPISGACVAIPSPALISGSVFGSSIEFAGTNVAVGAPGMNGSAGAVYQFNGTTLVKTFSPGVTGQRFGESLAWSGAEIFVGAPDDAASVGAVYACDPAGSSTCTKRFLNPFPSASDLFGSAIATLDGDLLVGASFGDEGTADGGSSYLMDGSTGVLVQTFAKSDAAALDSFGAAVGVVGGDVVIGAIRHKVILPFGANLAISSGGAMSFDPSTGAEVARYEKPSTVEVRNLVVRGDRAFVAVGLGDEPEKSRIFAFNVSTGSLEDSFTPPTADSQETFGASLSHDGSRLLVGSPSEDAAYLIDSSTGQLLQTFTPGGASFSFGSAVAFSEAEPVVGAPAEPQGGQTSAGAVYRFDPISGSMIHKLEENPAFGDRLLGQTLTTLDSFLFAGGPSNSAFPDPGRVFIYDATSGNELQILMSPTPASGGQFGSDLIAVDGRLVVGALFEDSGWRGRAHVFALEPGSQQWGATHTTSPTGSGIGNAQFGTIMAPFGRLALLGSPGAAGGDGRVYALDVRSGNLVYIARPSNRDTGFGAQVGSDSDQRFAASAVTQVGAVPADSSWVLYVIAATPNCGDGLVDAGEECDGTECCSPSCTILPQGSLCTDDGDACTLDQCDGDGICAHPDAPAGTTCDDDGVPCTLDQCNGSGICQHPQADDGTPCEDGNACTSEDDCASGICVGGLPTDCDDGNSCTIDGCVFPSGCTNEPTSGNCNDGNLCTFDDLCSNGLCVGQCDIGAPCPLGPPCGGVGECNMQGSNCLCSP